MRPMTPTRTRANEVGSPSLPQLWLAAMLRAFVELVHNVVATLRMKPLRPLRDWHTEMTEASLPREKTDTDQETELAVPPDSPQSAHAEQRSKAARPSKHERVLTPVSQEHHGSGPLVRVPRKGGGPVLLSKQPRKAPRIPARHSGSPHSRGTRRLGPGT